MPAAFSLHIALDLTAESTFKAAGGGTLFVGLKSVCAVVGDSIKCGKIVTVTFADAGE